GVEGRLRIVERTVLANQLAFFQRIHCAHELANQVFLNKPFLKAAAGSLQQKADDIGVTAVQRWQFYRWWRGHRRWLVPCDRAGYACRFGVGGFRGGDVSDWRGGQDRDFRLRLAALQEPVDRAGNDY